MSGLSPTQYIEHHLRHLELNLKTMHIGAGGGFWTLNLDTLIISVLLGVLFLWGFRAAAKRATAGAPKGWQNFVETAVEIVDSTVADTFHGNRRMVAPLALTIFVWVLLMNFMDLIPVDLIPWGLNFAGVHHFKVVPTADLSLTLAMALSVFVICIFFNFFIFFLLKRSFLIFLLWFKSNF